MRAILILLVIYFARTELSKAQEPTAVGRIRDTKNRVVYVLYQPKPEYPLNARERHYGGRGIFLLHFRPDGTVQTVDKLQSTGHSELDDAASNALIHWRVRAGPIDAKVPITFRPPSRNI